MKKKEGKNKKQEPISISKKKNDLRRAAVGDDSNNRQTIWAMYVLFFSFVLDIV